MEVLSKRVADTLVMKGGGPAPEATAGWTAPRRRTLNVALMGLPREIRAHSWQSCRTRRI